jgi:hypothetical protein
MLVALLIGAAGMMAAQGCFSVGENTKVQFASTNRTRSETQDLFQWTEIQSLLTSDERLLTQAEWAYLFSGRSEAYRLYARATVNGSEGLVILPDNETWVLPEGLYFYYNDADEGYATNRYNADEWAQMAAAGAVFLPADGYSLDGTEVLDAKRYGSYWTSSLYAEDQAFYIQFDLGYLYYENMHSPTNVYRSVRTVKAWEPQGIESVQQSAFSIQKVLRDGIVLIERNGKVYSAQGVELQ